MAASLNSGFTNNINVIQMRTSGSSMQRSTDRAVDTDGNGAVEKAVFTVTSGGGVGTPSAPGGKMMYTVTSPDGIAGSTVERVYETDGGIDITGTIFTEGT